MEKYQILKRIGEGAQGRVFLVRERSTAVAGVTSGPPSGAPEAKKERRDWVMKVVPLPKSDKERESSIREAAVMLDLSHPCIVGCKEHFVDSQSRLCIVMEQCRGGDLRAKIRRQKDAGKEFTEDEILNWFMQLALALEYLHRRKILHRDLKSENVFLRNPGDFPRGNMATVQVGDFGISRVLETTNAMAKTFVGTPYYMSPELFQGEPYDHKSDIWALGCLLYEMLMLRHPFQANNITELAVQVMRACYDALPTTYSPEIRALVGSMLAEDPQLRPTAGVILSLPILRDRATAFLSECQIGVMREAGENDRPQTPTYTRRSEIVRTVRDQGRRLGFKLSIENNFEAALVIHGEGGYSSQNHTPVRGELSRDSSEDSSDSMAESRAGSGHSSTSRLGREVQPPAPSSRLPSRRQSRVARLSCPKNVDILSLEPVEVVNQANRISSRELAQRPPSRGIPSSPSPSPNPGPDERRVQSSPHKSSPREAIGAAYEGGGASPGTGISSGMRGLQQLREEKLRRIQMESGGSSGSSASSPGPGWSDGGSDTNFAVHHIVLASE